MRKLSLVVLAAFTLGITLASSVSVLAQEDEATPHHRVFGYQDSQTGTFHPVNQSQPEATSTAASTGTLEVVISINLKTAVPTGASVYCATFITATSETVSASPVISIWEEQAYSLATVSGSTATCTVSTPYSWNIPAASSTQINTILPTYTVAIVPTTVKYIGTYGIGIRSSTGPIPGLTKVPATSTTPDKYTVSATL